MNTPHFGRDVRIGVVASVMLVAGLDYSTGGQRLFL